MMAAIAESRDLSVLVTRAEDIEGEWISHCLELDVMSQGDSIAQALAGIAEAIAMAVEDDLSHGLDPFSRRRAPDEYWHQMDAVIATGRPVQELSDWSMVRALVTQFTLRIRRSFDGRELEPPMPVPEAWQIAAFENMRSSDSLHS